MAIAQVGATTTAVDAAAPTSITVNVPTGHASGHVGYLGVLLNTTGAGQVSLTNWTRLIDQATEDGDGELSVFRRVFNGSEGSTVAPSWTPGRDANAAMLLFSGVDNTTPEDVASTTASGDNSTPTATGLTTATANALLLAFFGQTGNGNSGKFSSPTSPLVESTDIGTLDNQTLGTFFGIQAAAGASGNKSVTATQSQKWVAALLALRPQGATAYTQDLTATVTPAATLVKRCGKVLAATETPTGILVKRVGKVLIGSLTPTGVLSAFKVSLLSVTGTLTPSATLIKSVGKMLAGTLTPAATLAKGASRSFTGTVTPAATCVRSVGRSLEGSLGPTSSLVRSVGKMLAGIVAAVADLANQATTTAQAGTAYYQSNHDALSVKGYESEHDALQLAGRYQSDHTPMVPPQQ